MKVECVDRIESTLCVATIQDIVAKRLMKIHFDGWEPIYDQWIDYRFVCVNTILCVYLFCRSTDIYPIGYAEMVGQKLEKPKVVAAKPAAKRAKKT
jgi:hypothetical protein